METAQIIVVLGIVSGCLLAIPILLAVVMECWAATSYRGDRPEAPTRAASTAVGQPEAFGTAGRSDPTGRDARRAA